MIAGYKLKINGGGLVDVVVDVGLVYEHLFEGLLPGTTYGVQAASYNEDDDLSSWGAAVFATTDPEPEPFALIDDEGNGLVDDEGDLIIVLM